MLLLHLSDQRFYCLLRCAFIRGLTVTNILATHIVLSKQHVPIIQNKTFPGRYVECQDICIIPMHGDDMKKNYLLSTECGYSSYNTNNISLSKSNKAPPKWACILYDLCRLTTWSLNPQTVIFVVRIVWSSWSLTDAPSVLLTAARRQSNLREITSTPDLAASISNSPIVSYWCIFKGWNQSPMLVTPHIGCLSI